MRMKFFRILPETCASTWCLFSSSTLNMALGSGSRTVAITSIASSLLIDSLRMLLAVSSWPLAKSQEPKRIALLRQNHRTFFCHRHAMFKMCAAASVGGYRCPLVIQYASAGLSKIYHRFNCENHAFPQPGALPTGSEVGDLRLFVEPGSDTVAHELAHYTETISLYKFLHRRAYIADRVADPRLLDALIQRSFRDLEQLANFRFDRIVHGHGNRSVAVVSIENHTAIDGNDVARLQHPLFRRNAVHNLFVHRGAKHARIIVITLERRLCAQILDLLLGGA